jgi:hypothetical protein
VAGLCALLLVGCAGYRLGPSNQLQARDKAVYVEPFRNDTLQPRLEDDFTHAVRNTFQREGTYRLGHRSDCDMVVQGVIKKYSREGISYDPTDLVQVQDYNLSAVVHITAYDKVSGKKLLDQDVSGQAQVRAGNDLMSAERQATPLLANALARRVVDLLADGAW